MSKQIAQRLVDPEEELTNFIHDTEKTKVKLHLEKMTSLWNSHTQKAVGRSMARQQNSKGMQRE